MQNIFVQKIASLRTVEAIVFCTFAYFILFLLVVISILVIRRITR